MPEQVYTYLKFVRFKDLDNWGVQYALNSQLHFGKKFHLESIGYFLTRNKTAISVEDDVLYKRVTIKTNNGGCCLRDELYGKQIGTKQQFIISSGQFILSKIDARNGAMAVVPSVCDKAIITGNFWTFDVNDNLIDSNYLSLVTTTKAFIAFAEKASNGTTNRHYLQEPLFLSQKIPLPSLAEQQALVSAYDEKIEQSKKLELQAARIEQEIEEYLLTELGIKHKEYSLSESTISVASEPQVEYVINRIQDIDMSDAYHWGDELKKEYKYLKFVRFKDVTEWGYDIIKANENRISSIYPTKKVKEICLIGSGGTPSRSVAHYYQGNIPWIKTGEVVNESIYDTEEHITQDAIDNSSAKLYPKGSLIIAMYGQGDTRGRTAKMGIDATTNQACAVLYNIDNSLLATDYLWYYFQGRYNDLRSLASGNNQPNLNAEKIKNYDVVVPPIEIQNTIVGHISEQKEQIKQLKQKAETLRKEALEEFEKEIFE